MPLIDCSAAEAVQVRKTNVFATWGDRSQPNRVEPFARPGFDVPFDIAPGEKIFTVGSCFARNVEVELLRRGFELPMRELFRTEAFLGHDPGVVNNFGTPSIYNEFAWALGASVFRTEDHFIEVQPGRFVDLNVISSIRPESRPGVEARRRAITAAYRAALDCRVVIMTLGLVEVWFDRTTSTYLNCPPLPSLMRGEPDRFRLHVLTFEETYRFLEDALMLLRGKGRPDLRVILTVSPVPLAVTHRKQDVMVANSYSKSVLRAVAETVTVRHDFVTYYPSYESVLLSERKRAWKDDFTHVTDEVVALNVDRLIDALIGPRDEPTSFEGEATAGGMAIALERAREVQKGSPTSAAAFFERFRAMSEQSIEFALEHARFLVGEKRFQDALDTIAGAPGGLDDDKATQITAEALLKSGRAREAYDRLERATARGNKAVAVWTQLMRAAQTLGDMELVLGVLGRWSRVAPSRAGRANGMVGRWLFERGEMTAALSYFQVAAAVDSVDALSRVYHTETLIALGRLDEARSVFETINPQSSSAIVLHGRLAKALGVAA